MKRIFVLLCLSFVATLNLSANDMSRDIDAATAKVMAKVVEWRRHIHQYPELDNNEVKTAKYVEDHLRRLGFEVRTLLLRQRPG